MSRETSPCVVGDFWLDKRRDGKSPDIWQVATYCPKARSVVYRSTKRRTVELEEAKAFLRSHEAQARSTAQGQDVRVAEIIPHLFNYLREHGPDVHRLDTVRSSFRAWIGFLMQDALGTEATVASITPHIVTRFRRWRMGPHEWEVEWNRKVYRHKSVGVTGLTVQRNIEDLRAALNHADGEKRIDAPKVPSVDKKLRKKVGRTLLTFKQLGAILGYAEDDKDVWRELCLMIATACRPGAAIGFVPGDQWHDTTLDLQPGHREETDKRNAIVPTIEPLRPILEEWSKSPHPRVASRKKWWRTARRVLSMPDVEAYDIRHTLSTYLDTARVPGAQISGITGHMPESRGIARTTSRHYLHYDPENAPESKRALTKFFRAVQKEAALWRADHRRTIPVRGKPITLVSKAEKG